jgi:hypothetical protein
VLDFLQLRVLRPITINSGRQTFDTMHVKIRLDKTKCGEIGEERLSSVTAKRVASFDSGIDSFPPLKSRAERRARTTSPKMQPAVLGGTLVAAHLSANFRALRDISLSALFCFEHPCKD